MSWLPCKDWHHRPMQGWSGWWATHRVGSSCSAWGQQAALEDMQCVISLIWIVSTLWMMCMYTNFIATCTSTFIVCDIMQYMRNLTAWSDECHLANQSMNWYSTCRTKTWKQWRHCSRTPSGTFHHSVTRKLKNWRMVRCLKLWKTCWNRLCRQT